MGLRNLESTSVLRSGGRRECRQLYFLEESGHPLAEGRACDSESSPAKTDVLATVPRHQHVIM